MTCYDLNEKLSCLFILSLIYLNRDFEAERYSSYESPQKYDPALLSKLEDYGLVRYSPEGDSVFLTPEGVVEARGVLKFLQMEVGPRIGASALDIQKAEPELFVEDAAFGAGPLTTTELVYALAGVTSQAHKSNPAPVPTALENPPEAYGRDMGDRRSFCFKVSVSIPLSSYYYRSYYQCWRTILVPAGFTFLDLHVAIQDVLSWQDKQPFGFLLTSNKKNLLIGERGACGDVALPQTSKRKIVETQASSLRLNEVFPKTREAIYRYGTQTNWIHSVSLVSTELGLAKLGPQLLDGSGDAPPEWTRSPQDFKAFRDKLYGSERTLIEALAEAGKRGFSPFDHATVRRRLASFEDDRAAWQQRIQIAEQREDSADSATESFYQDEIPSETYGEVVRS